MKHLLETYTSFGMWNAMKQDLEWFYVPLSVRKTVDESQKYLSVQSKSQFSVN